MFKKPNKNINTLKHVQSTVSLSIEVLEVHIAETERLFYNIFHLIREHLIAIISEWFPMPPF